MSESTSARAARKENPMFRSPFFALAGLLLLVSGCAKDDAPPPAAPAPYAPPPPAAATAPYPQPAVATPTPAPVAPAPAALPGAPAAAGAMATPGPLALPCQNDQSCGFAKCNVQFQKCAFPCQTAVDCAAGASCNTLTGLCLPGAAPQ